MEVCTEGIIFFIIISILVSMIGIVITKFSFTITLSVTSDGLGCTSMSFLRLVFFEMCLSRVCVSLLCPLGYKVCVGLTVFVDVNTAYLS